MLEAGLDATVLAAKLGIAQGMSPINIQNPLFDLIVSGQFDPKLLLNKIYSDPTLLVDAADNTGFPSDISDIPTPDDGMWKKPKPVGDYSKWWWMDMLHYHVRNIAAQIY